MLCVKFEVLTEPDTPFQYMAPPKGAELFSNLEFLTTPPPVSKNSPPAPIAASLFIKSQLSITVFRFPDPMSLWTAPPYDAP